MLITDLHTEITTIKGIGKSIAAVLHKVGIYSLQDLLFYFPRAYSDRSRLLTLVDAVKEGFGTVKVKIVDYRLIGGKFKKILKILVVDEKGTFGALVCFNRSFLKSSLIQDKEYYITGKFQYSFSEIQTTSFEFENALDEYEGKILPVYSLTEGLNQNLIRKITKKTIDSFENQIRNDLPEWCIKQYDLMTLSKSIKNIHYPDNFENYFKARKTLIFEEFFFQKLFMLQRKEQNKKTGKIRENIQFHYKKSVLDRLPFELMDYQKEALAKIESSMFSNTVFSILLQGDVGSGKTVIALLAMLSAVESGFQAVLLVPTEVLALQHYRNIKKFTNDLWLDIAVLRGNMPKRDRDSILSGIKSGEIKIIIGTHSVFSDDVEYKNLGLAVVDEQHRFGVEQRCKLLEKGTGVDMLLMTATPIPQSLALSLYGDLDLIIMKGHIQGRMPVKTWIVEDEKERLSKMHIWIKETIAQEGRVIFVYPLIEDSEKSDNKNLMDEYEKLKKIYTDYGCEFIFSGTTSEEKDRIIESFRDGSTKILAATTVVEVGLDVPDANIIVVENADNYGLSTLHQLRGRVGRNNKQGYMILVADMERITEEGKQRLEIIKHETDGFKISEKDLMMRGPGDFIGNRQSGVFNIKLADIKKDMEILLRSSEAAETLFKIDKKLEKPEHIDTRNSFYKRAASLI
ncbi:MAG: ATP-dependent DNA helicase RecG [Spirochaetes bacterium GWF1_31_7]|nr:MAG: ATP-dependent DNA helicase RecG [Spirochaetes bacterium GWE1_32_154]OHD50080.1 MAG: ATP-dependent DNA helicase RecG [Spirochaetes bacterium GWE2_31_10]OHD52393.1 MAG: ATP-dependent DNA helicase RecG [Spirochaetes bacterium GWF1_31_7]